MSYAARQSSILRRPDRRRSAPPGSTRANACSPRRSRPAWASPAATALLNLCANNYLGLADHPAVRAAAREALDRWGYGMASVRFICGTQELHKQLERALSEFLGTDDTILYSSCWDANGGLFETLLAAEDAVISDELNHASIIDGVRLCKAQRLPLPQQRHGRPGGQAAGGPRGPLPPDRHRRRVLDGRDDRQPAGDLRAGRPLRRPGDGRRLARRRLPGPARPRHARVSRRDRAGSTSSPARWARPWAAAAAATPAARREIVELLRQRSRPYLFSNSLPPPIVAASLKSLEMLTALDRASRPPGGRTRPGSARR